MFSAFAFRCRRTSLVNPFPTSLSRVEGGTWKVFFSFAGGFGTSSDTPTDADWHRFWQRVSDFADMLARVQQAGYRVLVYIHQRPRWLSACPESVNEPYAALPGSSKRNGCPPRDYDQWERMVEEFARMVAERGVHPYYCVGNEPDWMLIGDEHDYVELYKHTAFDIKRADPDAKVGGPVPVVYMSVRASMTSGQASSSASPMFPLCKGL